MKLDILKEKIDALEDNHEDINDLALALEATYQQLMAISEQLENTEHHYELLVEHMSDIVWITDTEGTILYINQSAHEVLGYEKNEMVGKKLYEFMCPLHEYKIGSCVECVRVMSEREYRNEEMWMLHKDGKTRKVLEVNSNHVYHKGSIVEIQGIGRDVTERIHIQRKINKRNRYMNFINDLSFKVTQNLDFNNIDDLLDDTCKHIVSNMDVDLCSIRILEEDQFVLKSIHGRLKDLARKSTIDARDPVLKRFLNAKGPLVVTKKDVEDSSKEIQDFFKGDKIKEVLLFPLIVNGTIIGAMVIVSIHMENIYIPMYASLSNNIAFAAEKSLLYKNLKSYYLDIIMTLVAAMEAKDPYTQGHSLRVSQFSKKIAKKLGLSKQAQEDIEIAGILHDVGKIGIRTELLTKPGRLTQEEFDEIKQHPTIGMKILSRIGLSEEIKEGILLHHLRYDLKGYPEDHGVTSQPLFARIIGAADAFDAMTSGRPYRKSMSLDQAKSEILSHTPSQFCPAVSRVIVDMIVNRELVVQKDYKPLT